MKKWVATTALIALSVAPMRADLMFVQTMTIEGAAADMISSGQMPRMTMRIKGQKSRADIEVNGQTMSSIADIATKQVIVINSATRTATISTPESAGPAVAAPKIDVTFTPTGKSQVIEGQKCEEHALTLRFNMAEASGGQLPPEAMAMMQDVDMVMTGAIWLAPSAPGAAEYTAFNKAALSASLVAAATGMAAGKPGRGFDKLMEAAAAAPGLPYLTDITMTMEGSGPMVEAMKQMGPVRLIQKITSVSTDSVDDSAFAIPEGYKIEKK